MTVKVNYFFIFAFEGYGEMGGKQKTVSQLTLIAWSNTLICSRCI